MFYIKRVSAVIFLLMTVFCALGQSVRTQQGAVLKRGGGVRISGAVIQNKRSMVSVTTNQLGFFSIVSTAGDTLSVSAVGYTPQTFVASDFKDAIIYLIPVTQLDEVIVQGKSLEGELKGIQDAYRGKGVYYNGRPPLLAAIFSPLTAINELFGKNAKRARRFQNYASQELDYQEITRRFNDLTIRNAVPSITNEELPVFRGDYLPTVDQIRTWNDYDLMIYIKKSFKEFREKSRLQDSTGTKSSVPENSASPAK
ncbi:hypothetical protein DDR33_02305 [Pararcticibacter amylolyticus]|uniref:Carboxypeptidase-like regulatory domain-containing protein n=2 Tax=Pararcticibacter amylolyticus TaxID=2173175 RepID=A0A2U2PMS3_9SPHI|nr:hypothetical protein DDR33_02305 [Pararcticibacter amylolyticus]